jgi:hypothetical protein
MRAVGLMRIKPPPHGVDPSRADPDSSTRAGVPAGCARYRPLPPCYGVRTKTASFRKAESCQNTRPLGSTARCALME